MAAALSDTSLPTVDDRNNNSSFDMPTMTSNISSLIPDKHNTLKTIHSPKFSTANSEFVKSVSIQFQDNDTNGPNDPPNKQNQKDLTLVIIPIDSTSKSAFITDNRDEPSIAGASDSDDQNVDEMNREEHIAKGLFRLQHGYTAEEYALACSCNVDDDVLDDVQGLTFIHRPHTDNLALLLEQLRTMQSATSTVQLQDPASLNIALQKCERVFAHHQRFDQFLKTEPTLEAVLVALYHLIISCTKDTVELIEGWAIVYHTLCEIVHTVAASQTASIHSPRARRSLFAKKSKVIQHSFEPEVVHHYLHVCANWSAQIKSFEHHARFYQTMAGRATAFSLINEITTVNKYYDRHIRSTFEEAQIEFLNTKQLSQLNSQIDYSNLYKQLPKQNALTTAEERKAHQPCPLFTRQKIGKRRLIREGRLFEFVPSFASSTASTKKKRSAPPTPKEYRLIVSSDMIYLCEVVIEPSSGSGSNDSKEKRTKGPCHKSLLLIHEPVLVIDAQISSTPDVVYPPVIQKDIVMVCFYNETSYILQAESSEERDAWVECARQLNIEQPKPTDACREQDDSEELQLSKSSLSIGPVGKIKGSRQSLLRRLKTFRRSSANLTESTGTISEINPDQLTRTEEEERARRMELGQPSLWEVRRLPLDLGVIPPLEHPIPFRKSHLYDINVKIVDLTTGKAASGEFGMGIEDRAAYFRDECALFAVLRPARLIPYNDIDRTRDDFFLCGKRRVKGEVMYVEPPSITDFYARSWLHPDMHIEFNPEERSVMIAKMYCIYCSTTEIVSEFQKYYHWLMDNARISPDNTFLCMDYRSHPLRVSKRIEKAASAIVALIDENKVLEAGRKFTEMGECHVEFRRMSNAPDALSVGFYNPATRRDMAMGVMVFDKNKVKATASGLGLNAITALGVSNGMVRVSTTEMSLTLWQTDARTRPTFVKGQRIYETVKTKSLDVFKLVGPREVLDELEDFIRVRMGTDCKARDIKETMKLAEMAFQDQVMDAPGEEENVDQTLSKSRGAANGSGFSYGHRSECLETVLEENEEQGEEEPSCQQYTQGLDDMSVSTATFHFKSKEALGLIEKKQQALAASELSSCDRAEKIPMLEIEASAFNELSSEDNLSAFLYIVSKSQAKGDYADKDNIGTNDKLHGNNNISDIDINSSSAPQTAIQESEEEEFVLPSVKDLTRFWARATSAMTLARSASKNNAGSAATLMGSTALIVGPVSSTSFSSSSNHEWSKIESGTDTTSTTDIITKIKECTPSSSQGIIQTSEITLEGPLVEDRNRDVEPGVDVDHHLPVKDLKERWEQIHRLGV
ncbi:hypothetical protein BG011_005652 [Mortierella polycephala]|uniref:PH domain-containing protein n=1 Tax=Mortierella polycephala TaxID=41804 RepID=A0A9P6U113_9FUNG|nr:hypothetical protein BG011_005652 [Mortierella polycephala]